MHGGSSSRAAPQIDSGPIACAASCPVLCQSIDEAAARDAVTGRALDQTEIFQAGESFRQQARAHPWQALEQLAETVPSGPRGHG